MFRVVFYGDTCLTCWRLPDDYNMSGCVPSTEQFEEKAISYREFADNPSVIDDPNLVVKIGTKYVSVKMIEISEKE